MLARDLQKAGVLIESGYPFFGYEDSPRRYFRMAYSSIPAGRIPEGLARTAPSDQNSPAGSGVTQNLILEIIGSEEGYIKKSRFG